MAKKTIPLNRPKGTDGQGNIKVPGGPMVLDLGDFDDMFGPLESDSPKGGPLDDFWSGLKESFSERTRTKDVVRNFLRSAAPDGISNLMGFADEALSASRDIKESLERTNASDLQYIAKRAQALLPKLQEYAPEGIYNDISQGLENKIDEYDYTIQSQRDQTSIRRMAKDQSDTSEIETALDNIALSGKVNHNRAEQGAQTRHNQMRAEASVRDLLKTRRFDFIAKSMGMANDHLQQINGYNQQVNFGFQRKGLELQFRSYMGIKELIKLQEANLELNARAFNAMIRNTGMTDFQKNGQSGLTSMGGQGNGRQGLVGRAVSGATNKTLSNFLGNYGGEAQGRITDDMSRKLSMMVMAMKMGQGSGGSMWKDKYKMAGNLAGDVGGDFILNQLIPMLGREARPGLTKMSDKHLGGAHNKIGYHLDNMPAFLQEFVNNNQNQHGMKGKIRDMIAPYVPQFGLQDRTKSGNFQTIDQPAQFNQMTQRTIVDAIPGYLARILQTLRQIKTGNEEVGREVWDVTTGKFTVESAAHDSLMNKIVPKNAIRSASTTINDALNTMDADGSLSPKARKALSERMLRDASTNRRFDPEAYVKAGGYAKDMPADVAKELEGFFGNKFEMDERGGMVDNAKNNKLRQEFSQAFLDIRSISRDPIKEIQRIIDSGNTEPLRAIGIIITEDGVDKINYPRIWELLQSGVTDGNPFAPNGNGNDPYRDDQSGKRGHKDFVGPDYPGAEAAWAKNKMNRFRSKYAPEEQAARDQMAKHLKTMRGRFGSAANHIQDMAAGLPGQMQGLQQSAAGGYSALLNGQYKGQMQGMMDTGLAGFNQFVGKSSDAINDAATKMANRSEEVITDLYTQFDKNYPALRAKDFASGQLIDFNTKKIITKLSDITGKVINTAGDTILSANEVAAGLMNPNGDIVLKVDNSAGSKVSEAVAKNEPKGAAGSADPTAQDPNSEENLNSQDWSLGPGENILLTARGLMNGEYMDEAGKVIHSIKDIAGDVYDKAGNLVLSAKEFASGLWGRRTGTKYRPTKGFARLLRAGKAAGKFSGQSTGAIAFGAAKFMAKAAVGIGSRIFNIFVDNQNAYLPGDPVPVLTRRAVTNGEYYDDKGKPIEDFVDVHSLIHDAAGEPVIPADQYKNLKNYDGTRHVLAKNKRIWGKLVMRPLRAIRNAYGRQTKKYYKWLGKTTVKAGGWLGRKTLGGFANAGGTIFDKMFEKVPEDQRGAMEATAAGASMANQPVVQGLQEILQELRDQRPKEIRKGSWQDQDGKQKEGDAKEEATEKDEEKKGGLFKRGLAGLAGMLGMGKKKGEEEEDEDDGFGLSDVADMAEIGDAVGDSRERGRARKAGKLGRAAGKGGRMASWGKKIAGSRLGQMGARVAASRVGATVGRVGGTMLLRGAMMAGTAIAGLLSGPVLLGIAAGAVVAGGGYLAYNRYKDISGEFRELRLAQYGVDKPVSKGIIDSITSMDMFSLGGDKVKILKMEALLEKFTSKDSEKPSFSINGAGGKELLDIMGIDIDDEAAVMVFARWLEKRFKPVYLAWVGGLSKIGQGKLNVNDVDDKLPEELKGDFLETIRFPYNNESPYAVTENPFSPSYPLPNNMDVISKMFDTLKEKYGLKKKEADAKKAADGKTADGVAEVKKATSWVDPETGKVAGAAAAGVGAMSAAQKLANEANMKDKAGAEAMKSPAGNIAATAAVASTVSGTIANLNEKIGRTLTGLQAIRMRAYGMQFLTPANVKAALALEAIYSKDLQVSETSVDYSGDVGELLKEAGRLFGKDTSVGADDRYVLHGWLTNRFTPVFRAYYGAARKLQPAANLSGLESKLTSSDKVTVGNAMLGAVDSHGRPVWDIPSLFDITGDPKDLKKLADADLMALQKEAEKEAVGTPTQKSSDQVAGKNAADQGGSFADKVMGGIKDTWDSAKETVSTAINKASDAVGDTVAGAKIALGLGSQYGDGGAKGGTVQSSGNTGTVVEGNGGQWEAIPMPTASGSIKAALPTLKAVAGMTGVPLDWLLAIVGLESGFRYGVKASTSSATGWFQFINTTWDGMYAKCVKKYGLPPDPGKTRAGRTDPRINALVGGEFTRENWEGLKKGLGRNNITDTDVYMAHFLGLYGALKFLRADPNALGYQIFKKEYSANMPLFFVDGKPSKPRTISQMYQMFQDKIAKFWATTGKGYRSSEGGSTAAVVEPQTPGAEKSPEQISSEQLTSSLKEDAGSKDGIGKSGSGQDPLDVPGSESIPTVASIAADTPPMPGAPATGGGASSPTSGVNSDGATSGGSSADTQRQAQMDTAQAQNTRREAEVRRDQQSANEVSDIQSKQLNTLYEIRDLVKVALEQIGNKFGGGAGGQGGGAGQSGNSMTPSGIQNRPAAQRSSALTLK